MLNMAIVDDDNYVCSEVEEYLKNLSKKYDIITNVDIFNTGEALKNHLCSGVYYDVVFLDIELDGISGLDISYILRKTLGNEATQIVYISGKTEYAIDVFDYDPIHFLPKPLSEELIDKAYQKILRKLNVKEEAFAYKIGSETRKIPLKDIIYFESDGRKVVLYTDKNKDSFYGSLEKVYLQLKSYGFILIHKSFLINSIHVRSFAYESVVMSNQITLQIAQLKRKDVRKRLLELELKDGGGN